MSMGIDVVLHRQLVSMHKVSIQQQCVFMSANTMYVYNICSKTSVLFDHILVIQTQIKDE